MPPMDANALVLIDIQQGFDDPIWGARNNPDAEDRAGDLLTFWRQSAWPVVHVKHVSVLPNSPLRGTGTEFQAPVAPRSGEVVFEKSVNSAFIGTSLQAHLNSLGTKQITICGLTTPHCVSTTTRMAANLGFSVDLVADACAAFEANADTSFDDGPTLSPADIHRTALAHLNGEFARVCEKSDLI